MTSGHPVPSQNSRQQNIKWRGRGEFVFTPQNIVTEYALNKINIVFRMILLLSHSANIAVLHPYGF